jgi:Domain of unknown function(DUF2779)
LARGSTVYEAAFSYKDVVARADGFARYLDGWHMTEVKAATSVKDYFYRDCAVQAWVAEGAGYPVRRVTLAHTNNQFVYPGGGKYAGMLDLVDATAQVERLKGTVGDTVKQLREVLARNEPDIRTGEHCASPYDCPFLSHCRGQEPVGPEYPVEVFGYFTARRLRQQGIVDALEVDESDLDGVRGQRILRATREQKAHFEPAAQSFLASRPYPRYFLDFETVASSVPLWAGTRPYQQIPFQWSCHAETESGVIAHSEFLDISGGLPAKEFARTLIEAVGTEGPVVVYSVFERSRLEELCALVQEYRQPLSAIMARLLDLLPVVRSGYYHPAMKGSFSVKQVAPTVCPELDYSSLGEVTDGSAVQRAWWEASSSTTDISRRTQLVANMLRYCQHDTLSTLALFRALELGRSVSLDELVVSVGDCKEGVSR